MNAHCRQFRIRQGYLGFKNDDIKSKLFPVFKGFTFCEIVGFRVKIEWNLFCMYIVFGLHVTFNKYFCSINYFLSFF